MKKGVFHWLFHKIRSRVPAIIFLTFAEVGHAFFGVMFALGSRGVIDSAVSGKLDSFLRSCLVQAMIILATIVCLTISRQLIERLNADLERDWKRQLLHGLLHGEFAEVSKFHSGELLNRLNNDVSKVNSGILSIVPGSASMVTRLVVAAVVLGALDFTFLLVLALVGVCVFAITAVMRYLLKELNKRVSEHDGKVSGFFQECMEKLLMVQAMDVSNEVKNRADALLDDRYAIQQKRKNVSLLANTFVSILSYGAGFAALGWCGYGLLKGEMTFGSLTAVVQLVNQIQMPIVNLSGVIPRYVAMVASAERLQELDSIQGDPAPSILDPNYVYDSIDSICAESLCFSYERDVVLSNTTFALPKGAFAVITGPSGIGKSTLLKLMLGIFAPEEGMIFFECKGRKVLLDRSTRRMFAYVPQGNLLLSGSLRDNLTIVAPDATDDEICEAIYVSAMDEFLPSLPLGLDTILGENGAGLSEGQVQRVAIARAILGKAPILLLDECTSALDAETEHKVLMRIRELPNRTCISVTHRPAAVALCDYILEVNDGKIIMHKHMPT